MQTSFLLVFLSIFIFSTLTSAFQSKEVIANNSLKRAGRYFVNRKFMGNSNTQMSALRDQIETEIKGAEVMIYSKTYCPYCTRAKEAIKAQNVAYKIIELDVRINA
jgi:thioredoxin-related protein